MTRVLICHDWALIREGMRTHLEGTNRLQVFGTTDSGVCAVIEAMSGEVDIVVTGLTLRGFDGLELIRRVRACRPAVRVIVLLDEGTHTEVEEIISVAPDGVVSQECTSEEFCYAVNLVAAGQAVLSGSIAGMLMKRFQMSSTYRVSTKAGVIYTPGLTNRETEVLTMMAGGRSTEEIAADLTIALTTVRTHLYRLRAKLGVRDRAGLVSYAFRTGMVGAA